MRKLPSSIGEYTAVASRRWKLFLLPVFLVPVLVFFVSRRLPRSYRSTTSVLIQTQIVPKNFVDETMQTDVKDRFESISNLILSQSRLMRVVDQLGLYKLPGVSSREEALAKLRKDLTIEMESDHVEKQGSALFKITYVAPTAQLAQDGAREVASLSISGNLESRERQVQGNMAFIQSELDRAQVELKVKEDRLNLFRSQHSDMLPGQAAANLQVLSQDQALALSNSEAMERADQQRAYAQSMLDADIAAHSVSSPTHIDPLDPTLAQKREELRVARQRYTDKHPDVTRLQNEINALQTKSLPQASTSMQPVAPTVGQRQLQNQLTATAAEMHVREQRQAQIEARMRELNNRVHVSPVVAGEAAQLQSDYEAAQKYYNTLVEKQHTSAMSVDLEKSRGHDLIQVLDPANLPRRPYSPNLRLWNLAGIGLGVLSGLLLALAVELFDATFHDQEDIATYLNVPMIAIIPTFNQ